MIPSTKPALRKTASNSQFSFDIKVDAGEDLASFWHYHPELELIWLKGSRGTKIIGNSVESFSHNEVLLIGKNVPHIFIHEKKYLGRGANRITESPTTASRP